MNIDEKNEIYPLILSMRFVRILRKINDDVSNILIQYFKEKKNFRETFIDRTEKEDIVSFISSEKVNKMISEGLTNLNELWLSPLRVEIKIGRLVNRIVGDKVKPQEIENFVNDYKAIIKLKELSKRFKIIEGDDIKKWYLQENYAEGGGNLSKSCMRFKFCQSFLDLYSKNPEKIKLLILLDETKNKILGRAVIWVLDVPKNKILMDRVYFTDDFILNMFINYAIKNDWFYKLENMDNVMLVAYKDKIIRITLAVGLKKLEYNYYPFIDNIGFYDPKRNILTNDPKYLKKLGCESYYDLCDVTGGYEVRTDFDF